MRTSTRSRWKSCTDNSNLGCSPRSVERSPQMQAGANHSEAGHEAAGQLYGKMRSRAFQRCWAGTSSSKSGTIKRRYTRLCLLVTTLYSRWDGQSSPRPIHMPTPLPCTRRHLPPLVHRAHGVLTDTRGPLICYAYVYLVGTLIDRFPWMDRLGGFGSTRGHKCMPLHCHPRHIVEQMHRNRTVLVNCLGAKPTCGECRARM